MMPVKFITLSNYRSGSSPFQRMLDSHPDISARQEDLRNFAKKNLVLEDYLINIFRGDRSGAAAGFKVQYDQIVPGLWEFVDKYDVKVIQLIRRDLLETALWMRKNLVGNVDGGLGPPLIVRGRVEAKIDKVLDYMVWLKDQIDKHRSIVGFTVYYYQMSGGNDAREFYDVGVRKRLLDFLGVSDRNLYLQKRQNIKNNRGKNENIVINWEELIEEMNKRGIERYYQD